MDMDLGDVALEEEGEQQDQQAGTAPPGKAPDGALRKSRNNAGDRNGQTAIPLIASILSEKIEGRQTQIGTPIWRAGGDGAGHWECCCTVVGRTMANPARRDRVFLSDLLNKANHIGPSRYFPVGGSQSRRGSGG